MGESSMIVCCILLLQIGVSLLSPVNDQETVEDNQPTHGMNEGESIIENLRKLQRESVNDRQKRRCENCKESIRCKTQGRCDHCTRICKDLDLSSTSEGFQGTSRDDNEPQLLRKPGRYYTIALFGPGPRQDLLARIFNIRRRDRLDQLVLLARAKSDETISQRYPNKPIIIDTANVFGTKGVVEPHIFKTNAPANSNVGLDEANRIEQQLNSELEKLEQNQLTDAQIDNLIAQALSNEEGAESMNLGIPNNALEPTHITTKRSVQDIDGYSNTKNDKDPDDIVQETKRNADLEVFEQNDLKTDQDDHIKSTSKNNKNEENLQTEVVSTAINVSNTSPFETPEKVGAINSALIDEIRSVKSGQNNHELAKDVFNTGVREMKQLINEVKNADSTREIVNNNGSELSTSHLSNLLKSIEHQVKNVADLVKTTCGRKGSDIDNLKTNTNLRDIPTSSSDHYSKTIGNAINELNQDTEKALDKAKKVTDDLLKEVQTKICDDLKLESTTNSENATGNLATNVLIQSRSNFDNKDGVLEESNSQTKSLETFEASPKNINDVVGISNENKGITLPDSFTNTRNEENVGSNQQEQKGASEMSQPINNVEWPISQVHNAPNSIRSPMLEYKPLEKPRSAAANRVSSIQEYHITMSPDDDNDNTEFHKLSADSQNKEHVGTDDPSKLSRATESTIALIQVSTTDKDIVGRSEDFEIIAQPQLGESNTNDPHILNNKLESTAIKSQQEDAVTDKELDTQNSHDQSIIDSQYSISPLDNSLNPTQEYKSFTNRPLQVDPHHSGSESYTLNNVDESNFSENTDHPINVYDSSDLFGTTDTSKQTNTDILEHKSNTTPYSSDTGNKESEVNIAENKKFKSTTTPSVKQETITYLPEVIEATQGILNSDSTLASEKINSTIVDDKSNVQGSHGINGHIPQVSNGIPQFFNKKVVGPNLAPAPMKEAEDKKSAAANRETQNQEFNIDEMEQSEETELPQHDENRESNSQHTVLPNGATEQGYIPQVGHDIPQFFKQKVVGPSLAPAPMKAAEEKKSAAANRETQNQEFHIDEMEESEETELPQHNENRESNSQHTVLPNGATEQGYIHEVSNDIPQFFKKKVGTSLAPAPMKATEEKKSAAANRETQNQEFNIDEMEESEETELPQHTENRDSNSQHTVLTNRIKNEATEQSPQNSLLGVRFGELSHLDEHISDQPSLYVTSDPINNNSEDSVSNPLTIFGKLVPQINNTDSDFSSIPNKKIYFVGNGMQLPLNIKPTKDGSLQLSVDVDSLCTTCMSGKCKHASKKPISTHNLSEVHKRGIKTQTLKANFMIDDDEVNNRQSELSKRSPNFRLPLPLLNLPTPRSKKLLKDDEISDTNSKKKSLKRINKNMKHYSERRLKLDNEYKERNRYALQNSAEITNVPEQRALLLNNVLNWMKGFTLKAPNKQKDK